MKKHLVLAVAVASGAALFACSSDKSKEEASNGAYPATTSSNESASAPATTASAETPTNAPATPTDNTAAAPSSSGTDVAAMETSPSTANQSSEQSENYEKS